MICSRKKIILVIDPEIVVAVNIPESRGIVDGLGANGRKKQ